MVVGARESFQLFRQTVWFLGNNRAFSKFRYQILYILICITKSKQRHSIKADFNLTTQATLKPIIGDYFSFKLNENPCAICTHDPYVYIYHYVYVFRLGECKSSYGFRVTQFEIYEFVTNSSWQNMTYTFSI